MIPNKRFTRVIVLCITPVALCVLVVMLIWTKPWGQPDGGAATERRVLAGPLPEVATGLGVERRDVTIDAGDVRLAAHAWLRGQQGIDPERVGLIGGSQSGWIIPLVAEKTPGVGFIMSGCGPIVSAGEEVYHEMLLNLGLSIAETGRRAVAAAGPGRRIAFERARDPNPLGGRTEIKYRGR